MKNLISIPTLTIVCSMIALQAASAQPMVVAVDSSHAEFSHFSRHFDSNNGTVQYLNRSNQFRNPHFDCTAFSPGSTSPRMKIFVPDTTLTASTPVLKPKIVDPEIFVPGSNCTEPESQN